MTRVEPRIEDTEERGRPVWALLGLLIAVSAAVAIMALGITAG